MEKVKSDTVSAWMALVTISRILRERIEADLKAAGLPALSWYDALLELEKAGKDGLRPYELKDRLLLPQYGTSRLLDRMIAAGLIEKTDCTTDARGFLVRPTSKGLEMRQNMWPIYARALQEHFGRVIDDEEIKALVGLRQRMIL